MSNQITLRAENIELSERTVPTTIQAGPNGAIISVVTNSEFKLVKLGNIVFMHIEPFQFTKAAPADSVLLTVLPINYRPLVGHDSCFQVPVIYNGTGSTAQIVVRGNGRVELDNFYNNNGLIAGIYGINFDTNVMYNLR